jgi:hypothetical protein
MGRPSLPTLLARTNQHVEAGMSIEIVDRVTCPTCDGREWFEPGTNHIVRVDCTECGKDGEITRVLATFADAAALHRIARSAISCSSGDMGTVPMAAIQRATDAVLAALGVGDEVVRLKWEAPADGGTFKVKGYNVYRSTGGAVDLAARHAQQRRLFDCRIRKPNRNRAQECGGPVWNSRRRPRPLSTRA